MTKLDSDLISLTLQPASSLDTKPGHRLIVLIPGIETDYTPVIHRIWELAYALECDVLFLGLCGDSFEEPRLRRALITMSALVHDGRISAEVKTEIGHNWLRVVKSNWEEGDLIVCFAGQRTGVMQKPLGQILESRLDTTVYVLSGFDMPEHQKAGWFSTLVMWTGFVALITGFFFLQINIDRSLKGWPHTPMLALTALTEFWLIWVWNSLFS